MSVMDRDRPRSSWDKLTWWFAAAWLPFLAFPMAAAFTQPHARRDQIVGVVAIIAFGAVYVWAFHRHPIWLVTSRDWQPRVAALAAMALLTAAALMTVGPQALGLLPFVVAWASFGMAAPWRWGVGALVLTILGLYGTQSSRLSSVLWLMVITLAVILTGFLTSHLVNRSDEFKELEHAHLLMAERDRFARDVHDLLGHSLTVVGLKVQLAQRLIDEDPDRARSELDDVTLAIKQALADVRLTVEGAQAPTSFAEVLRRTARSLTDAELTVDMTGDPEAVTGRIALPLGWVVQELATNVLRHASASWVAIKVEGDQFIFEDNGRGEGRTREGNGLPGMRARLAAAGADVSIMTGARGGTRTVVTW